jgi:hypothetical protein
MAKTDPVLEVRIDGIKSEVSELKKDLSSMRADLASMKQSIGTITTIAKFAAVPLLAWGTFITYNVITQVASGSTTKIAAELRTPKSPEMLRADLSGLTSQIEAARANGKHPDERKVIALSSAVAQVVHNDPQLPEAWQTAAQLISFRVLPKSASPGPCDIPYGMKAVPLVDHFSASMPVGTELIYHDCVMVLDDVDAFERTSVYQDKMKLPREKPFEFHAIYLQNVHVVYRGGHLLPAGRFIFTNCTFDFRIYGPPEPSGRSLTETLLVAKDAANVTYETPVEAS